MALMRGTFLLIFSIVFPALVQSVTSPFIHRHPPPSSRCHEPPPVVNAYRRFDDDGDVMYTCYHGYDMTSGSSVRHCGLRNDSSGTEMEYDGESPSCVLNCHTPQLLEDQEVTYNGSLQDDVAFYQCKSGYTQVEAADNATCLQSKGRWSDSLLYCAKSLYLTSNNASLLMDGDVSTCITVTADPLSAPHTVRWTTSLSLPPAASSARQLYDVFSVTLQSASNFTGTTANVSVEGGTEGDCDSNVVISVTGGQSWVNVTCSRSGGKRTPPRGHTLVISASTPFQLCELTVLGRPHPDTCTHPPSIPKLKMVSDVTGWNGAIPVGAVVHYECDDDRTFAGGSYVAECESGAVTTWRKPDMICSDEDFADNSDIAFLTNRNETKATFDGNMTTCVAFPSSTVVVARLVDIMEVSVVTVFHNRGNQIVFSAEVITAAGTNKTCESVTGSSDYHAVALTCPQRPRGEEIRILATVSEATNFEICEIRVLGRAKTVERECLETGDGQDYRGHLNLTGGGNACLPWASMTSPPDETLLPDDVLSDASNYCRNPGGTMSRIWCQTSRGVAYCPFVDCDAHYQTRSDAASYTGEISTTTSGLPCINWDTTGLPRWRKEDFPYKGDHQSYCRNPGHSQTTAWCYTAVNGSYGHCSVPDVVTQLAVYEEPEAETMGLQKCFTITDGSTSHPLPYVSTRSNCDNNSKSRTRLCITDTRVIAVRIWCQAPCSEPAPVPSAHRTYIDGALVTYVCFHGYVLTSGNLTRECKPYGVYTGDAPVCTLNCSVAGASSQPTGGALEGSTEQVKCPDGSRTIALCDPVTGQWQLFPPCEGLCSSPPTLAGMEVVEVEVVVTDTETGLQQYPKGVTVTYGCVPGFFTYAGGDGRSECTDSGWTLPSLSCTDETNHANEATVLMERSGSLIGTDVDPSLSRLIDNDDTSCVTASFSSIRVEMKDDVEVSAITLRFGGTPVSLEANATVESKSGRNKSCLHSDNSSMPITSNSTALLCEFRPVGRAVNVNVVNPGSQVSLCEIRIFGRLFEQPLGCKQTTAGRDYKGHTSTTTTGSTCVAWEDTPLSNHPSLFPDVTVADASNYCRNVGQDGVQCFHGGQGSNLTGCHVKECAAECLTDARGHDYTGSVSNTTSGEACLFWSDTRLPFRRLYDFPDGSVDHNHCRNPGRSMSRPWCYTNATYLLYDFCDIPMCQTTCPEPAPVPHAHRDYPSSDVGTYVTYTCYHGYRHVSGDLTRRCGDDGTYSGDPPVCTLDCLAAVSAGTLTSTDVPEVSAALSVTAAADGWLSAMAGSELQVSCTPPTPPVGLYVCNASTGRLDAIGTACPDFCLPPPAIPKLKVEVDWYTVSQNHSVVYRCDDGFYQLWGSGGSQCLGGNVWTAPTLRCEAWTNRAVGSETVTGSVLVDDDDESSSSCLHFGAPTVDVVLASAMEVFYVTVHFLSSATVAMSSQLPDTVDVSVAAAAKPTAQPCVVDVVDTLTSATCDQGPIGSVVRIQLSGALEYILVCEVRVFGRPFTEGVLWWLQSPVSATEGEELCGTQGAHLVSLHDTASQLLTHTLCSAASGQATSDCWIGLRRGLYDEWTDGTDLDFSLFAPGEEESTAQETTCFTMSSSTGLWSETSCDVDRYVICNSTAVTSSKSDDIDGLVYNNTLECSQTSQGRDYKGDVTFTLRGLTCLRWDDAMIHDVTADDLPDVTLAEAGNKCRNPTGFNRSIPWCYVMGPSGLEWEYCAVSFCRNWCVWDGALFEYEGTTDSTAFGAMCAQWHLDPDTAGPRGFPRAQDFPGLSLQHNYCRNPGSSQLSPWCYTDTAGQSFGHCNVVTCPTALFHYDETDPDLPSVVMCALPTASDVYTSSLSDVRRAMLTEVCPNVSNLTLTALCYTGSVLAAITIHCETCPPPPKLARMVADELQHNVGTTVTYDCAEGLYPVGGVTSVTCAAVDQWEWLEPDTLQCEGWTNYGANSTLTTNGPSDSSTSLVVDDDVRTCLELDFQNIELQLTDTIEISVITVQFGSTAVPETLSAHVVNVAGDEKACSDVSLSSLTVVRCRQRPVGSMVRIRLSSDGSSGYSLCELRVFGRRYYGTIKWLPPMNSTKAESTCRRDGGQLLSIHDQATQDAAAQLCDQNRATAGANTCWLGLTIRPSLQWADGTPVVYTYFAHDEPKDKHTCVTFTDDVLRQWTTHDCTHEHSALCGIPDVAGPSVLSAEQSTVFSKPLQCLQTPDGHDYKGDVNFTRQGRVCLRWDTPPNDAAPLPLARFPDVSLSEAGSKCRNPTGLNTSQPWCYVDGAPGQDWEYCHVPQCDTLCQTPQGLVEYVGDVSMAADGRTCVPWAEPGSEESTTVYRDEDFPDGDRSHNYCRNPDRQDSGPWCFTHSNRTTPVTCNVPFCPTKLVHYGEEQLDTTQRAEGLCISPHDRSIVSYDVVRGLHQQVCLGVETDHVTALCFLSQSYLAAVRIVCDNITSTYSSNDPATSTGVSDVTLTIETTPTTVLVESSSEFEPLTSQDVTSFLGADAHTPMPSTTLEDTTSLGLRTSGTGGDADTTASFQSGGQTTSSGFKTDTLSSADLFSPVVPDTHTPSDLTPAVLETSTPTILSTPSDRTPTVPEPPTPVSLHSPDDLTATPTSSYSHPLSYTEPTDGLTPTSPATRTPSPSALSASTSTSDPSQPVSSLCACRCRMGESESVTSPAEVSQRVQELRRELEVVKANLSSTRRAKKSAMVSEPVAATAGWLGVAVLVSVALTFVAFDVSAGFFRFLSAVGGKAATGASPAESPPSSTSSLSSS